MFECVNYIYFVQGFVEDFYLKQKFYTCLDLHSRENILLFKIISICRANFSLIWLFEIVAIWLERIQFPTGKKLNNGDDLANE